MDGYEYARKVLYPRWNDEGAGPKNTMTTTAREATTNKDLTTDDMKPWPIRAPPLKPMKEVSMFSDPPGFIPDLSPNPKFWRLRK